jgi:hypothetical protein
MFPEYMVLLLNFVGAGIYNPPENIVAPEPCGNSRCSSCCSFSNRVCFIYIANATFRRKSKDRLARNQDNVSELGYRSISGLLCQ